MYGMRQGSIYPASWKGYLKMQLFILWVFASIGIGVFVYGLYEIVVNDATI
jgi:hypothetical protein